MLRRILKWWLAHLLLATPCAFAEQHPAPLEFAGSWEMSSTEPGHVPLHEIGPGDISAWQPLTRSKVPDGINQTIWLRNRLPQVIPSGYGLHIANGLEDVAIYIGSEKIYQYGSFEKKWNEVSSQRWHLLPLKPEWAGATIHLRYHYSLSFLLKTLLPDLRFTASVYDEQIKSHLLLIIMAGASFLMALVAFILAAVRRKIDVFVYFGFFSLAVTMWSIFNQDAAFKQYLGVDPRHWAGIDVFFLYLGVAALYTFLYDISRLKRIVGRIAMLGPWCIFGSSVLVSISELLHPWYLIPALHVTALFAILIFTPRVIYLGFREAGEARTFGLGCFVATVAGLHDMLRYIDGFPHFDWPMIPFGQMALFGAMGLILAKRFSEERMEAIRIREKMIEEIEAQVEEKTRDIRSIMRYIPLGIFTITRDRFKIHKDYSQHLQEIFETHDLLDKNGCDLIFARSNLSSDEKSQATSTLEVALGEEAFILEANSHCLPSEIRHRRYDSTEKILQLTWNPILDSMSKVEKILVTVRDVTELRAFEEEANDKREELNFIGELINVPADAFRRFIQNCHEFIDENRKLLKSTSIASTDLEVLKVLFINMHTLKGAARSYYFKKMTQIFHDVEQYYAILQRDRLAVWDLRKMHTDLDEVEEIVSIYESINRDKLGRVSKDEKIIEMPEDQVVRIYRHLQALEHSKLRDLDDHAALQTREIRSTLFPLIFTSAQLVLEDVCRCVDSLARDLEKLPPIVTIDSGNFCLDSRGENLLRKIFVHILRNSMDHGIEKPETRRKAGKADRGHIKISIKDCEGGAVLSYFDDGRGLDIKKIRETAILRRITSDRKQLSEQECAALIFHAGLSTAGQINDISGRGVGMDAVRRFLSQEGGSIAIHLLHEGDGKDFCQFYFDIYLPLHLFASQKKPAFDAVA